MSEALFAHIRLPPNPVLKNFSRNPHPKGYEMDKDRERDWISTMCSFVLALRLCFYRRRR
jgi:hypothetical protein